MLDSVIIKNISSLFSLRIAGYIIPLITLPYLVRVLEPVGYGTFAFCLAIIQYFSIAVNYGFDLSATKRIAESKNDKIKISLIYWNILFARLLIAITGFGVLCLLPFLFEGIDAIFFILLISYLTVLGDAIFPQWLFQGKEQLGKISIIRVVSQLISIPLLFLLVKSPEDIWITALLTTLPPLITALVSSYLIRSRRWVVWCKPTFSEMKGQLADGWHLFISSAAISLYTTSTTVILGVIAGPVSVAVYVSANKLLQAGLSVYSPLTASFYPRINSLMAESKAKAVELIKYVLKLQIKITLLIGLGMYFFSPFAVKILFGEEYERSADILQIMSVLPFIIGLSNVFGVLVLLTHNYKKEFSIILMLSGLFSLISLVPLSYFYDAEGAAISVVITESIVTLLMFFTIKKYQIPVFKKFRINNEV
ncbi:flippase [Shewanella frigidimarina]|uniref:flippase n=1 Tax=Shewanella frigidimarina TaxID=56812 RepID=UPI000F4F8B6C|nr:flippase [Shewanella frigidimarina]RPA38336.1 flippase [Shewanella frigidimarina]